MDYIQIGLTTRDWIALGGAVLILTVLIDAFRRLKQDQDDILDNSRKNSALDEDLDYTDLSLLSELPNGGARIVNRDVIGRLLESSEVLSTSKEGFTSNLTTAIASNDLDIPRDSLSASFSEETLQTKEGREKLLLREDTEVLALNVVSRQGLHFSGDEVLKSLLKHDLRFGYMQFFHRHEQSAGRGAILFSVADMMKPGVFDIDNISVLRTKGLLFFLTLPGPIHMLSAFDAMLDTAASVADCLGGDLRDESRSVLTQQALDHHRYKISELEHRHLVRTQ